MAEVGQGREPIRITDVSEREFSRKPERTGGFEVIVERIGVDQYGHEWHSFHRRFVSEREEIPLDDNPPNQDRTDS